MAAKDFFKITCISDTHNHHKKLELGSCDVLIHTGDATHEGTEKEYKNFLKWFGKQPAKYKVLVPGNHDMFVYLERERAQQLARKRDVLLVIDRLLSLDGLRIWGSPWQPTFGHGAFQIDRYEDLEEKWSKIPEDIHVLATHGPPFGILDDQKGCQALRERVDVIRPLLHTFGHIHEGQGVQARIDHTISVNAACFYKVQHIHAPSVWLDTANHAADSWV